VSGGVVENYRRCVSCGKSLVGRYANARTCGEARCQAWSQRHPGERHPTTQPRVCAWCGVSIDHRNGKARFCSKEHSDLAWVANNPDLVAANNRRYQKSERGRTYAREYQQAHAEDRRRWARESRRQAPERYRAYDKAWRAGNQEAVRHAGRTRHSRKRSNGTLPWVGVSLRDWQRLVRRYGGRCSYCGGVADPVHMDHVIPLAKGGRHTIGNVLPACDYCNCTKHSLLLAVWRMRNAGGRGKPLGWSTAPTVVLGERNGNARLNPDKVRQIRQRHAQGVRQVALAAEFGITQAAVSNIVRRKTWKHVI
jgi:hypothetical protein